MPTPRVLNNEIDLLNIANQDNDIRDSFTRAMISEDEEPLDVATRDYDVNEFFIGNDRWLYKTLRPVIMGETLTPTVNCFRTTLSDQVYRLFGQSPDLIREVLSNLENGENATINYAKGEYFIWYDGFLYKTLAALTIGTPFEVNANIVKCKNITDEILKIKSDAASLIKDYANVSYQTSDTASTTINDTDYVPLATNTGAKKKALWSTIIAKIKGALTKSDVGLGNVENKSSATIRSELTKANVTTALGYTPPTKDTTYSAGANISQSGTVFSLTKANVTNALGYTPPTQDTNTTYSAGTGLSLSGTIFSAKYGTASGTACQGNDSRLSNSRTPTSHASTSTAYGGGTSTNYGHVKPSDIYDRNVGAADNSIVASQAALYNAVEYLKPLTMHNYQPGVATNTANVDNGSAWYAVIARYLVLVEFAFHTTSNVSGTWTTYNLATGLPRVSSVTYYTTATCDNGRSYTVEFVDGEGGGILKVRTVADAPKEQWIRGSVLYLTY